MTRVTAQKLDGTATAAAIKDELRVRVAALRSAASSPGWARCWSATTRARGGTSTASTRTAPRSGSSRSGSTCPRSPRRRRSRRGRAAQRRPGLHRLHRAAAAAPGHDENRVLGLIDPAKDADGLHPTNLGWLVLGNTAPLPCTPHGIVELLRRHDVPIAGADVVVVGRGVTVGRPLGLLLTRRTENATVTLCHTGTVDLAAHVRQADIVVAAAGVPGLVTGDMVKAGAAVLDVGVSRVDGKLAGDVADDVWDVAGWVSPNPGGVGPMTRAMLLSNIVTMAEQRRRRHVTEEPDLPEPEDRPGPEERRYPSTIGGAFYLAVLASAASVSRVVAGGDWRLGVRILAVGLMVGRRPAAGACPRRTPACSPSGTGRST